MTPVQHESIDQHRVVTPQGVSITYERFGRGPPLVLVHSSFTDHRTNWQMVAPELAQHFTLHALARRGRGGTDPTTGHSVEDEAEDVATLIEAVGQQVRLLGHSYGALVALTAARGIGSCRGGRRRGASGSYAVRAPFDR